MKKFLATILAFAMGLSLSGCGGQTPPDPDGEVNVKTYEQLYDGNAKTKYDEAESSGRYRASFGWTQNDRQGYNQWYYLGGSPLAQLPYAGESKSFTDKTVSIGGGRIYPGNSVAALRFASPRSGSVVVSGTLRMAESGGSGASLKVLLNGAPVYPASGSISIEADDLTGIYFNFETQLKSGDELDFEVVSSGAVYLNPTVDYSLALNDSLYALPDWGYYGDLHQYYHNDTVNLYHLRNLGPDQWEWYLDTTKDMFRYERAKVYDTSFVENHYMAYAVAGDLVDYEIYPDGGRDCTLFYDEQSDVYRYIGLTYKRRTGRVNCDLSMRVSKTNDIYGDWEHASALRSFPDNNGEPECAAFRQIDDTWYLYAGISGQSVHGVGGLSYWMGEKGAKIGETDWQNAATYRLDGEDLAVPQIENVGGRWYLYGWMPRNYCGGEWGGYKNLPREVFRRENGLLGTRLDPMATKLVNRGKIVEANKTSAAVRRGGAAIENSRVVMSGNDNLVELNATVDSSLTTGSITLNNATQAGIVFLNGGKEYRALLVKKEDGVYMEIGCPDDLYHKVSSSLYLGERSMNKFDFKLISEGAVMEFYVNDTLTLSGRTALSLGAKCKPALYANGAAEFDNVTVYRLAQTYDIYD